MGFTLGTWEGGKVIGLHITTGFTLFEALGTALVISSTKIGLETGIPFLT